MKYDRSTIKEGLQSPSSGAFNVSIQTVNLVQLKFSIRRLTSPSDSSLQFKSTHTFTLIATRRRLECELHAKLNVVLHREVTLSRRLHFNSNTLTQFAQNKRSKLLQSYDTDVIQSKTYLLLYLRTNEYSTRTERAPPALRPNSIPTRHPAPPLCSDCAASGDAGISKRRLGGSEIDGTRRGVSVPFGARYRDGGVAGDEGDAAPVTDETVGAEAERRCQRLKGKTNKSERVKERGECDAPIACRQRGTDASKSALNLCTSLLVVGRIRSRAAVCTMGRRERGSRRYDCDVKPEHISNGNRQRGVNFRRETWRNVRECEGGGGHREVGRQEREGRGRVACNRLARLAWSEDGGDVAPVDERRPAGCGVGGLGEREDKLE
ncbi:hypothetical protein R3P38DRAFT_3421367 [Favolaschia claudopus]|uniref:Uncharacterized protein n=1 Tax=Favolaschia claudopus TaxID=2862362 RepID=A0AAW0D6Q3_9AGAR